MKKILLLIHVLIAISIVSYSQVNTTKKDTADKKSPVKKDRNMFGHGIPRGLTITSDGLTDGYVMFAVPNSASVYLITLRVK